MKKLPLPEKLKICLIASKFPMVGRAAEHNHLLQMAKGLSERGHQVWVLAHSNQIGKSEIEESGIKAFYLNQQQDLSDEQFLLALKNKFIDLHSVENFHLVHCIDNTSIEIIRLKRKLKLNIILDIDVTHMSNIFSILGMSQESSFSMVTTAIKVAYQFLKTYFVYDRFLLKNADGVFVSSPQQRLTLERYYLYPDNKTYNINFGVELSDTSDVANGYKIRERLGIPNDAFCAMTFSDMRDVEEIRVLLLAFEKTVIKKPNSRLIIIGHGPQRKDIEFLVYNFALGSKVHFTGAIKNNEVADYVNATDIFISLSSRTSGFESYILESMSQEKIVVGSEISSLSTLIEDSKDGFLVRPADVNGIAKLTLDVINQNIDTTNIKLNAKNKVMTFFNKQQMIQDCIEAYYLTLKNTGKFK